MKTTLFLFLIALAGCSGQSNPTNSNQPTPTPSNTGNVYLTWTELSTAHGCSMNWEINGQVVPEGSASVTDGTGFLLYSNLAYGSYPVSLSYVGSYVFEGTLHVTGAAQTIVVSQACGPSTSITIP